jgi:V-type H+-transporting ATPase subunit E
MSADSSRQIKQMVNFIMQEAHEKVNELKIKVNFVFKVILTTTHYYRNIICIQTDHDFNLEKQNLVHNGKLRIQEEYVQKEKDLEIEQRV